MISNLGLTFALSPTKTFNLSSVTSMQGEESQHNTSGLSSSFGSIPFVLQYQQIDTPQPFSPSQLQPAPSQVPTSTQKKTSKTSQPVQPTESAQVSRLACTSPYQDCSYQKGPSQGHPNLPKTINSCAVLPIFLYLYVLEIFLFVSNYYLYHSLIHFCYVFGVCVE